MRALNHMKILLAIAISLTMTSCLDRESVAPTTDAAYQQKMITRVVSFIQAHEKQFTYLSERKLSSKDIRTRFAQARQFKDGVWIKIPVIRYLRDSISTADSLYFAPKRIVLLSQIEERHSKPKI